MTEISSWKLRPLAEVQDKIGLISNQSALLNTLTGNTRLLNMAWLGWSRFAQVLLCAHLCDGVNILVVGGWVWLSSTARWGKISEKEDQWASQPASYGGLKTFHDLRDATTRSNQLYTHLKFHLTLCSVLCSGALFLIHLFHICSQDGTFKNKWVLPI